uniref:Uncharacterized protein n=1 Tax=Eutreptiella gymnastica TaxID=73025 RepID=A0A7S1J886_9EUGL
MSLGYSSPADIKSSSSLSLRSAATDVSSATDLFIHSPYSWGTSEPLHYTVSVGPEECTTSLSAEDICSFYDASASVKTLSPSQNTSNNSSASKVSFPTMTKPRCKHRASWKRIRGKRNSSYYLCEKCGLGWRIYNVGAQQVGADESVTDNVIRCCKKPPGAGNISGLPKSGSSGLTPILDSLHP